jgi:hypothetical protein
VHLYDSKCNHLRTFGPNSSDCRQVWIKDVIPGIYFYMLEIKLANSTQYLRSKFERIFNENQSIPRLTHELVTVQYEEKLIHKAFDIIRWRDKYEIKVFVCSVQSLPFI